MTRPGQRRSKTLHAAGPGDLERGRQDYARRAWADAYDALAAADRLVPLDGEHLELMAMSAYLVGRDDDYLKAHERAHHAHLAGGKRLRGVRCAFWLGLHLLFRGETGRANGWLARAQRLLEREEEDCVERGYLLLPVVEQRIAVGKYEDACAIAAGIVDIGDRFQELDLSACALHQQGRALIQQGRISEGLARLDEAMLAVTGGELSPFVTGLVYCSVIETCQHVYALARASEWTSALAKWCGAQSQMLAFTGTCLVHRAEIMQLHGAWPDAVEEARRACERCAQTANSRAAARAFYQQAEVYRLRGEFDAAEEAYRKASQYGWDPQPGLALLRLIQGRTDAATASIRRVVSATEDRLQCTRLLPAYVEIMVVAGDLEAAQRACRELEETAVLVDASMLHALAAQARGTVELAKGDAPAALGSLRRGLDIWQQIGAPYWVARMRLLIGTACRALGDAEAAALELSAARAGFEQLGAKPDLARLASLAKGTTSVHPHGLTRRELQVLRLVAAGKTNKAIARELSISEKTVDRHVSNIFTKLNVPSRTAATAYAYEHNLIRTV